VLLVDGELPQEDLQTMLAEQVSAATNELAAPLRVLAADLSPNGLPSLVTPRGQAAVEANLEGVELIVLDSLSTLCSGAGPENDAESWEVVQAWLLRLRRLGLASLLMHHDGKTGAQRGTSKREDILSQIVQLRRPEDYHPSQGARFEVNLMKARGVFGAGAEPFEATFAKVDGSPLWTWQPLSRSNKARARALSEQGTTQRAIAEKLGIGLATVNRYLRPHADGDAPKRARRRKRRSAKKRT
jgi:hypothetical protein